ncbi:MAG: hypothetical protein IJR89_01840 [Clostridia bacterium]|nr:hypothetical protein [Clostridia bacterium]
MTELILNDLILPPDGGEAEACALARKRLKENGLPARAETSVYRFSVDARRRQNVRLVWSVRVRTEEDFLPAEEAEKKALLARLHANEAGETYDLSRLPERAVPPKGPPVIVGMGPAGLFAALLLAKKGMRPVLLERGGTVRERIAARDAFYRTGRLDPDCNVQFGAGGAGTFSDGKLVTRVNDPRCRFVLEELASLGAPREILTRARPHVGTDLLPSLVERAAERIAALGGRILYRTALTGFSLSGGRIAAAQTTGGEIPCSSLVLACGHSARDVYSFLPRYGVLPEVKPFSVGVRIEHTAAEIDRAMYGALAGHPALGHAEYNLSHRVDGRGVYTFCMCPGGEVVAAATEEGGVVTNGMSPFARDGVNSNAAVAVSVFPSDCGSSPEGAIAFQRELERRAFSLGGGGFAAPVSTVGDLMRGTSGTAPSRILPTYMGGRCRTADLASLFPPFITQALRGGLAAFGRTLTGFDVSDAVLTAAETRTSAPLRIPRDPETLASPVLSNLYPCGEGAGYAGGITSAAADGLRAAEKILLGD